MNRSVLDASAILTLLQDEPGSTVVMEYLPNAVVSAVNLSEVIAKLAEAGMPEQTIRAALTPLALDVRPFDEKAAYVSGGLRPHTKVLGLSFGDRACLGLALALSSPAVTTERAWKSLKLGIKIVVAR